MTAEQDRWLGVDIGGTKIQAVVVDAAGREVLAQERVPTLAEQGRDAVCGRALDLASGLMRAHRGVRGVGVGFAGLVDRAAQRIDSSVILPGWDGFDLREVFEQSLDRPCAVDNDATVAGIGEHRAIGSPPHLNMVLLTIGTGIGGAIFIDGSIYRGSNGVAAEFGNVTIDWLGEEAPSGNRGSLNLLASGTAMCRSATERARRSAGTTLARERPVRGPELAAAYAAGDPVARSVVEDAARALGAAIANCVNIFNPDRVALTGGVLKLGEPYLNVVRREARERAFSIAAQQAEIVATVHGELTGAHGAACFGREACA